MARLPSHIPPPVAAFSPFKYKSLFLHNITVKRNQIRSKEDPSNREQPKNNEHAILFKILSNISSKMNSNILRMKVTLLTSKPIHRHPLTTNYTPNN